MIQQERSYSGVVSLAWRLDRGIRRQKFKGQFITEKLYLFIARDQKSDLHGTSFQSSSKINRMLITRLV